ncbi:hypothetical protein LPY66_08890 [Dehalobacter sp. DCM]|uniref:hypothetical protein n=1 Tax=Dehalobacter sp. DCM TaxID=2907827 RepID=UPI0030815C88|nr:hypothetical protein LPY66_08890 [Dehalobacter sp. DCM]
MSYDRVFTDQELQEMSAQTQDLIKAAIDAGELEKAKILTDRLYEELAFIHDGYMCWITGLLTHIYNKYGAKAVEEAERDAHTMEAKIALKPPEKTDFRSLVQHAAKALHGHVHQPMSITEDEEKVTITVDPCGSGGRIMQKGGYEPEVGFAKIKEAGPMTWGMKDLPMYCVHCPVTEMLAMEGPGDLPFVHPVSICDPKAPSCQYVFYKNPADIPEEFYTRIGKKKPDR